MERPPTVPLLSLASLRASSDGGGGSAQEVSPPLAGVRGAGGRGGAPHSGSGGDSASERTGHVPTRPGSRSGPRGA